MKPDPRDRQRFELATMGARFLTRDQAVPLRGALLSLLDEGANVEVVLDGAGALTPSFIDELLGKTLVEVGEDRFRRQVALVAGAPEVRHLVNLVLSNRRSQRSEAPAPQR